LRCGRIKGVGFQDQAAGLSCFATTAFHPPTYAREKPMT
jgi:hypothetical protein